MIFTRILFTFLPTRWLHWLPKKMQKRVLVYTRAQTKLHELWDMEFMLSKSRAIREGYRNEFDRVKEKMIAAESRIKAEESKGSKKDEQVIGNLQKVLEQHKPELKTFKEQIDKMDLEARQYTQAIEGYRAILGLVDDFIKKI